MRQPSVTIATFGDEPDVLDADSEPACSTTSRTHRFARAAGRRAAPVPDVACARWWIAFATGAATRRWTIGVALHVEDVLPLQREHHGSLGGRRDTLSGPSSGRGSSGVRLLDEGFTLGGALRCERLVHAKLRIQFSVVLVAAASGDFLDRVQQPTRTPRSRSAIAPTSWPRAHG
jgi:hypothetical protein